jgi:hypothetical protein
MFSSFLVNLGRKRDPRTRLSRLDYTPLLDLETKVVFADTVTSSLLNKSHVDVAHSDLTKTLSTVAFSILPKRNRAVSQWFAASEVTLRDSINRRNLAFNLSHKFPTPLNRIKYISVRSDAQLQVRKAKSKWMMDKCNVINDGFSDPTYGKSP